jgi:hypothetical protein
MQEVNYRAKLRLRSALHAKERAANIANQFLLRRTEQQRRSCRERAEKLRGSFSGHARAARVIPKCIPCPAKHALFRATCCRRGAYEWSLQLRRPPTTARRHMGGLMQPRPPPAARRSPESDPLIPTSSELRAGCGMTRSGHLRPCSRGRRTGRRSRQRRRRCSQPQRAGWWSAERAR